MKCVKNKSCKPHLTGKRQHNWLSNVTTLKGKQGEDQILIYRTEASTSEQLWLDNYNPNNNHYYCHMKKDN